MSAHLRPVPPGQAPRLSPECELAEQTPDLAGRHGWCPGPCSPAGVPWLPTVYCDCTCHESDPADTMSHDSPRTDRG